MAEGEHAVEPIDVTDIEALPARWPAFCLT